MLLVAAASWGLRGGPIVMKGKVIERSKEDSSVRVPALKQGQFSKGNGTAVSHAQKTALVSRRIFKAEASLPMPDEKFEGSVGPAAAFHEVALTTIGRMSMAGIRPDDDVLDIGCGVGRTARYLCDLLGPDTHYEGFDIMEDGIRWCQENITPAFPNFRFQWMPVSHSHYSPDSSLPRATELEFPYPNRSFDFAFAHSVFTHLLPDVTQHYLDEVAGSADLGALSTQRGYFSTSDRRSGLIRLRPRCTLTPRVRLLFLNLTCRKWLSVTASHSCGLPTRVPD